MTPSRDPAPWLDETDRRTLSELCDGRADGSALTAACSRWAADASLRRQWHAYQLIGDVLRSEDLAAGPRRDAEFLSAVRERLAREPTQEPIRLATKAQGRRSAVAATRWAWPVAAAAGLVAVVGGLLVLQGPLAESGAAPALASATPPPGALRVVAGEQGQVLRDARIDEYLQAHRATLAGSPAALPGGAMRNVELIVPSR